MRFGKLNLLIGVSCVAILSACSERSPEPQVVYQQPAQQPLPVQQQPVYVQQQPVVVQQGSNSHDMLMGGMLGYMLGSHSGGGGSYAAPSHTTVVNKTVVNKTVNVTRPSGGGGRR
jgi:hypothetical protein